MHKNDKFMISMARKAWSRAAVVEQVVDSKTTRPSSKHLAEVAVAVGLPLDKQTISSGSSLVDEILLQTSLTTMTLVLE